MKVNTPPASVDVALWIATLDVGSVAYIQGAAFQRMASYLGVTEADLYAGFAERASQDPDCQVVRP